MLFVPYLHPVLLAEVARRLAAAHADPVPREGDEADRVPEHRYPLNKHAQNNNAHPSIVRNFVIKHDKEGKKNGNQVKRRRDPPRGIDHFFAMALGPRQEEARRYRT